METSLVTLSGILTLVSATVGIISALRSQRLAREKFELERRRGEDAHRASLIDDMNQVLETVKEENGRLGKKVEDLEIANRAMAQANDRLAERVEELEEANRALSEANVRLTERVEELEAELARLSHLRSNVFGDFG